MPRKAIGDRPMTITERTARHRQGQSKEILLLRNALLDALEVFDKGAICGFCETHAEVIARAKTARRN